jgi:hypothetical protein
VLGRVCGVCSQTATSELCDLSESLNLSVPQLPLLHKGIIGSTHSVERAQRRGAHSKVTLSMHSQCSEGGNDLLWG